MLLLLRLPVSVPTGDVYSVTDRGTEGQGQGQTCGTVAVAVADYFALLRNFVQCFGPKNRRVVHVCVYFRRLCLPFISFVVLSWPNKFCALVVVLLSFIYLFSSMFFGFF